MDIVTPEKLFQFIGELFVENRMLKERLSQILQDKKKDKQGVGADGEH